MNRLLLALAFAGASSSSAWAQPKPAAPAAVPAANGVAADVNGDRIPLADLNRMVETIKASDPSLQTGTPEAQKSLTEIKGQMLDQLITTRLLAQEAKKRKIVIAPKTVNDALAQLRGNFKSEEDFQKWLKSDGKTVEDVKGAIADELAIRQLSTDLTRDITISANDVSAYYRAHLDEFKVPESVKARHIMLAINPNASQADRDAVMNRAQKIIKQLRSKGDFAKLAKENSDDPDGRANGGDMGQFGRGDLVQSIEDACFAAKAGEVIPQPVPSEFGLHIIRVDAKIPASTIPLSDIQNNPQIKAILLKQKVQARLDETIAKLRAAAVIKKNI